MDTIKFDKKQVKMVAHRGVSGLEMENTNAAFVAAGNRSYFGIETDVHVTKDKQIVVVHDDNLKRVAGVDLVVEESNLADILAAALYDKAEGQYRTDLHTPVLADYIKICKKYGKTAVLELKNRMEPDDIAAIAEQIRQLDYLDGVIFISFAWENLIDLRKIVPGQKAQFLTTRSDMELVQELTEQKLDLDIYYKSLTKQMLDACHENGLEVNCWTVDCAKEAEKLAVWGVDYITSNILE